MSLLVDLVSDPVEEFLLHVDRTPADPGDLYDDEAACIVQAEITLFRVYDFVGIMTRYYLKLVVQRYIGDLDHGTIDRFARYPDTLERRVLTQIYSPHLHRGDPLSLSHTL